MSSPKMPKQPPTVLKTPEPPKTAEKVKLSEEERKRRKKRFSSLRIQSQGNPAMTGDAPGVNLYG
tara:strand:- start:36 stop:230 length:195 start_codon:yes stop_codon:yes gene_type:complete